MAIRGRVVVGGMGKLRHYFRNRARGGFKGVDIGFLGSAKYGADKSSRPVTNVAAWQEFGTRSKKGNVHVPARPFLKPGIHRGITAVRRVLRTYTGPRRPVLTRKLAGLVGETYKMYVQESIRQVQRPPLKENTIRRKGSDKPLIDSGLMIQSVTWSIRR